MKEVHRVRFDDARRLCGVEDDSIALVVTSPPYPMIGIWDEVFARMDPDIGACLSRDDGAGAFEAMHAQLDLVWERCFRVLVPGGIACINIGDATRTIGGEFGLWSNHSRVVASLQRAGFTILPDVIWRKQTNAPNKFMGSGMLPAGAYVTYEHEYILVARKGGKRKFARAEENANRRRSAYFWEERNVWFSDVWLDLKGVGQELVDGGSRSRSGAFPFELPYRLIQMYSVYGDKVLDPFLGTGTTSAAAIASGRSSIGVELDAGLADTIRQTLLTAPDVGRARLTARLEAHQRFVEKRLADGREIKHRNAPHGVPVITRQEVELELLGPARVTEIEPDLFESRHGEPVDGADEVVQTESPLA